MTEGISFTVNSPPKSKQRPRLSRRGKAYTPKATHDAERAIVAAVGDARGRMGIPLFDDPVCVLIDYYKDHQDITVVPAENNSKMRADIDNMVKLTLDALQQAGVYANDKQVVEIWAAKF